MVNLLKKSVLSSLALLLFCAASFAQSISGVVTNQTNNRPASGDDVVLLKLAQGMQELARTKTDSKGRFTINVPEDGLHLLRVTHDKANYFHPVQPGTQSVDIDVYTASDHVEGVTLDADVMRIQTDATATGLKVVEHFFVKNESSPQKTLFSDHPFELYLPPGAIVEGSAAKAPGGMAVQSGLVPMSSGSQPDPNHYTLLFPIRPGETEFQVSYKLPYKDSLVFNPRPAMTTDNLVIMLPKSMTFKPVPSAPYVGMPEEMGAQTYVARGIQPSQPVGFTLSGSGELPRDTAAGQTSATGDSPGAANVNADPNLDKRPGSGLGTPLDKDAVRESWVSKYRWWLVAGLFLLMCAGAAMMLARPTVTPLAAAALPAAPVPTDPLQTLRDEMFTLETDRLEGRVTEAEYTQLKGAFDLVLRRALARTVRVVPE